MEFLIFLVLLIFIFAFFKGKHPTSGKGLAKIYFKKFKKEFICDSLHPDITHFVRYYGFNPAYDTCIDENGNEFASYFDKKNKIIAINEIYKDDVSMMRFLLLATFATHVLNEEKGRYLDYFTLDKINSISDWYSYRKDVINFCEYILMGEFGLDIAIEMGYKTINTCAELYKVPVGFVNICNMKYFN